MRVIDNFLPSDQWEMCLGYLNSDHWSYPPQWNPAHQYTNVWRIFDKVVLRNVGGSLFNRLGDNSLEIKRVGINGAMPLIESHPHVDGDVGDTTLLWFANPEWHPQWGGELIVYHDENAYMQPTPSKAPDVSLGYSKIDFVPNRAVIFDSHLVHRPNSPNPTAQHKLRMSVGLHLRSK